MLPLSKLLGPIDIYLLDQILKGRIQPGMRILDAGCGGGRNLIYFFRQGYEVFAADRDAYAIEETRVIAKELAPKLAEKNFRVEAVEEMSFSNEFADVVLSSAVLHFADDEVHFAAMLEGSWRKLKPGGLFFCRLASSIGIEHLIQPLGSGRYLVPDGSERFLVNTDRLEQWTQTLGASYAEPLKTTLVDKERSMTTWVLRKDD